MRRHISRRFVRWYMGRVAGRCCPCEWPIKSRRLMHLCGRIDDAASREDFRDFCGHWLHVYATNQTTTTTATTSSARMSRWC